MLSFFNHCIILYPLASVFHRYVLRLGLYRLASLDPVSTFSQFSIWADMLNRPRELTQPNGMGRLGWLSHNLRFISGLIAGPNGSRLLHPWAGVGWVLRLGWLRPNTRPSCLNNAFRYELKNKKLPTYDECVLESTLQSYMALLINLSPQYLLSIFKVSPKPPATN